MEQPRADAGPAARPGARIHGGPLGRDEALELATAHALLRRASAGHLEHAIRIYRPPAPAVVFGRRDTRLPGFQAARSAAVSLGFAPFVRVTGGRAVAYTSRSLVVDVVRREPKSSFGAEGRFEEYGGLLAAAFRGLGVDARVGAVPGEYCPGAHSVNARGVAKLVGTAQRAVRDAWLFSALVVVDDGDVVRPVLERVYAHLDQPFDPASVGSLADERPGVGVDDVVRVLQAAYGVDPAQATAIDDATYAIAVELRPQHLA